MNEDIEIKTSLAVKWLKILFYIGLASLIHSVITVIPVFPAWLIAWVSRVIMIAIAVCTYQLNPVNERYGKSAKYRAVMVIASLVTAYLIQSAVLTFVASICSLIAAYQEYGAHGELIAQKDPKQSGKWHSLFYWGFVAGILISMGSLVATLMVTAMGMDFANAVPWIVAALGTPQIVIDIMYLRYLRRMVCILEDNEVRSNEF